MRVNLPEGIPIEISRSNRPARRNDESSTSGRDVAPINRISDVVILSIELSNWAITRAVISFDESSRDEQMASSSSRKITHGLYSCAVSKSSRMFFSDPPETPDISSENKKL